MVRSRRPRLPRIRLPFARDESLTQQLATPTAGGIAGGATPTVEPSRFSESLRAFKHRNYRLYYTGQSFSLIGTWMQTAAQAWLVTELTDSEVALGVAALCQFLPIMLFVLPAGVLADRIPKRDFLIATQSLAMLQAIVLAVLVVTGAVELWHVYVLALLLGLSTAFDMPSRQSFAIEMVGRGDLVNAVALNSAMFNGARLIGPAIGGFIIASAGTEAVFSLNALSFVPILITLFLIRKNELYAPPRKPGPQQPFRDLKEGISYAWKTPSIRLTIILVAMIGLFGYNFTVMLPLLARHVLHEGSVAFGLLISAVGLGSLAVSLLLAGRKAATRFQMFVGASVFSVGLFALAFSGSILVALGLLVIIGAAGTTFATTANTTIQLASPDEMRGRVVSLYMLLFAGSTPIGGLIMGALAATLSTEWAIAIFGAMCGVGTLVGAAYYYTHKAEVRRTSEVARPAPA